MDHSVTVAQTKQRIEDLTKAFLGAVGERAYNDPFLYEGSTTLHKMVSALELKEGDKVLYIGTGSGFGTFVVSSFVGMAGEVHSYEIKKGTLSAASTNLSMAGCLDNVHLIEGDALSIRSCAMLYDKIIVAAGAPSGRKAALLNSLLKQANPSCIIVVPLGELTIRWEVECHAVLHRIKREQGKLDVSKLDNSSPWHFLEGRYGFSDGEVQTILRTEFSCSDDQF